MYNQRGLINQNPNPEDWEDEYDYNNSQPPPQPQQPPYPSSDNRTAYHLSLDRNNENYSRGYPVGGLHVSSSSEGFHSSQRENCSLDDEPNDVLVWNTAPPLPPRRDRSNTYQHQQQSHGAMDVDASDAEDGRPLLPQRTTGKISVPTKSRSIRSAKHGESDRDPPENQASADGSISSAEYENQMQTVAKQLEMIKTTQESILSELSSDISNLQFENVQLKNTNEHLTMQNSHLLQVISDLTSEVEHMREVFRMKGWLAQEGEEKQKSNAESPQMNKSHEEKESKQEKKDETEREEKAKDDNASQSHHRSRRRSRSRSKEESKDDSRSTAPTRTPAPEAPFVNVPLDDNKNSADRQNSSGRTKTKRRLPTVTPGEEQVDALSRHRTEDSGHRSSRRSRAKTPSIVSGASYSSRRSSKPSLLQAAAAPTQPAPEEQSSSWNCFRGLFKKSKRPK